MLNQRDRLKIFLILQDVAHKDGKICEKLTAAYLDFFLKTV